MSIVVRYAPVPASTIEQYDESCAGLRSQAKCLRTASSTTWHFFQTANY
jgi:hypothetical protein